MRPNDQELAAGMRLAAIAAVSAVLTATVVVGAGRSLTPATETAAAPQPAFTRAALR